MLTQVSISGAMPTISCRGRCDGPRLHEVEARMTPHNALHPLFDEAAFPAHRRGMATRADALSSHRAIAPGQYAGGKAPIIARPSVRTLEVRARRNFNVHAHAYRCAPPGGNPGRRRQGKPDRKSTRLNSSHMSISYAV